jgi:hypothetical protein
MASAKEVTLATQVIQDHVLRPYEDVFTTEAWRDSPEVPSATEIMPKDDDAATKDFFEKWSEYQQDPVYDPGLPHNVVNGPWPSKEEYIAAHYRILREDAIASLRSSIKSFKRDPEMFDDKFTHVYTHVSLTNIISNSSSVDHPLDLFQGFDACCFGARFSNRILSRESSKANPLGAFEPSPTRNHGCVESRQ